MQNFQLGIQCFWELSLNSLAQLSCLPSSPRPLALARLLAFVCVDFFVETRSGPPLPGCLPSETPGGKLPPRPYVAQLALTAHGA